ncbi:hypothetical protein DPMN_164135 [Dreissena polymorpha]|uniref:Uncharacterized protein n=1 Tax=Dreissena polymorpha TaxID=45954 RepID=A0A9D4ITG5_DREPO|nr:hypothetical protein DPMN_164135 [Dreissena polymorpha]
MLRVGKIWDACDTASDVPSFSVCIFVLRNISNNSLLPVSTYSSILDMSHDVKFVVNSDACTCKLDVLTVPLDCSSKSYSSHSI